MLTPLLSVTGVEIFLSWIKENVKEKEALISCSLFSTGNQRVGPSSPPPLLPAWTILLGLSATSFLGHSLLYLSSHAGHPCLEKQINIKYPSKVLYSQPRSLSQNKKGNLSLVSHGHWEAGNSSLAGRLGKNSPSGFQVYLTNSFTTCQTKLLLFK